MPRCQTPWCVNMWVTTLHGRWASTSSFQDVAKVRAPSAGNTTLMAPPLNSSTMSSVSRIKNTARLTHTKRVNMPPLRHSAFTSSHMVQ